MNASNELSRQNLIGILAKWKQEGLPSRYEMEKIGQDMLANKQSGEATGIWDVPAKMVTATLDDALGQGIEMIELFAKIAGIEVIPLGVCQSPETIISECNGHLPNFLGITVLRSDATEDLINIGQNLPAGTKFVVGGGPFLRSYPETIDFANVHFVARDVAAFLRFLLNFE